MHAKVTSKVTLKHGWTVTVTLMEGNQVIEKQSVPYYVHGNEIKSYQEAVRTVAQSAGKFIRNLSAPFDTTHRKMDEANVLIGCTFKIS